MRMSGTFTGKLTNTKTGEIICWEKHNKVVKNGFDWVADLMSNTSNRANPISFIAFGTDSTTTTYNTSALGNEVGRFPVTATWDTTTRKLVFSGSIPQGSGLNYNIAEAGLFNAATGGVLFDRATFLPKGVDDNMSFTYNFTITLSE